MNDWKTVAQASELHLGHASQGEREALLATLAAKHGVKAQTLRTYLVAWRFLKSLPSDMANTASSLPAICLETASRWSKYDPVGARKAIASYSAEKHSIRSFARAELAARRAHGAASGPQRSAQYVEQIKRRFRELVAIWPQSPAVSIENCEVVIAPDPSGKCDFMVQEQWGFESNEWRDFGLAVDPKGAPPMAVVVVGPYSTRQSYEARAADWCLRALGLTFFHARVALVLPSPPTETDAPNHALDDPGYQQSFVDFMTNVPNVTGKVQLLLDPVRPETINS